MVKWDHKDRVVSMSLKWLSQTTKTKGYTAMSMTTTLKSTVDFCNRLDLEKICFRMSSIIRMKWEEASMEIKAVSSDTNAFETEIFNLWAMITERASQFKIETN